MLPYVLLGVGSILLFLGLAQAGLLVVYFIKSFLGLAPWQPDEIAGALIRIVVNPVLGVAAVVGGRALIDATNEASRLRELYYDRPWL